MANERFLSVAREFTFGSLPTSGWKRLKVATSDSLALNRETVPSAAIRGKRGRSNVRAGNDTITGNIALEIAVTGMEFMWYHALGSCFSNGTSPADTGGNVRGSGAAAGATVIPVEDEVVGTGTFVGVGDFARFGDPVTLKDSFVRKITAVTTTPGFATVTVDEPIPRVVTTADDVYKVLSPFTHVYTRSTLPTSFSVQRHFEDLSQFFKYSGCRINSLALTIPGQGLATATADIRGKTSIREATATGPSLPDTEITPFIAYEGALKEDNVPFGFVTNFALTIANDLVNNLFVLGSREVVRLPEQAGNADGTLSVFFEDATIADKFRNEDQSSLEITFTNGGNTTIILLPAIKYTGGAGDPVLTSAFGPVMLNNMPFQAFVDTVEGTDVKVTVTSTEHAGW